ncbi:MAG: hypothetical protein HXX10_20845 [Rhodoplanes sp.]|uniref:hypothetical protein n=1 Tax=Rhodoplanes sp. TaxID=1968906 RepID=UPI0017E842D5|nr:hypothetical protein [Rhodoplanes sp.]NVO16483.1 hypothetical protein [Rhodoplanes sp.]
MPKKITDNNKKRGRPTSTGTGTLIGVRLLPDLLAAVVSWIKRQDDAPSRPEAIRRLVELGLASTSSARRFSKKKVEKAAELAERQIERLVDPSATTEDRQRRKHRLLKGPEEFRDLRGTKPKR